jgi:hypothetical protein
MPDTQPRTIGASETLAATLAGGGLQGFMLECLGSKAVAKNRREMQMHRLDRPC